MAKIDIASRAEALLVPILEENHFELVDVEYVKEGNDFYLRGYIDKEGSIAVDDCEMVSRAFEKKLDEEDFITDPYILEISSPGLTRPLKKERDYQRNIGKPVEIHLYKPLNKQKDFCGILKAFDGDTVTIDEDGQEITLERSGISMIRQYFEW
ncbi:MAG: ribosome maturation factor RimP [Lachnospiraceae bacterium]|nr:ribosome maturation factor RimP [Lachnospiraceae bacterium]